jgi:hypothetical protein
MSISIYLVLRNKKLTLFIHHLIRLIFSNLFNFDLKEFLIILLKDTCHLWKIFIKNVFMLGFKFLSYPIIRI